MEVPVHTIDVIRAKRDGDALSDEQIEWFLRAYTSGEIADEQAAALLMAIVFNGLDGRELATWTAAMIESGERLDLSAVGRPTVDKHSTGGVGDKVSLVLVPLVAACGAAVPQLSGRGLGHTGGTLDKMEAIPGWRADLTPAEMISVLHSVGGVIAAAGPGLAPADRKLYALRDVTGTVESIPLIASSIMSKKLAAGADAIVLDVKVGDGAFMKTREDARILAEQMIDLGRRAGREVVCLLTDMDQPLGAAVGNALEIREAVETLRGDGPPDFTELVLDAAARLLALSDLGIDEAEGHRRAETAVADGSALATYERWIRAQGGDPGVAVLPVASVIREVRTPQAGTVVRLGALAIGVAALELGAGRRTKADVIDHAVGIVCRVKRGEAVEAGAVLAEVHASDERAADTAADAVLAAYTIGDEPPRRYDILLDVIG